MPGTTRYGWLDLPHEVHSALWAMMQNPNTGHPIFAESAKAILDSGAGKTVLLHLGVIKVTGRPEILKQGTGDCTSFGAAKATDTLKAAQIVATGQGEFRGPTCTEAIYAGGRVEISHGRFGRGAGCTGAAVARCVSELGTLVRGVYGDIDVSSYSSDRADEWGLPGHGIPDALEAIAREHLVRTVALVKTYAEARAAIVNGYPVTVASSQGFNSTRDKDGCLRPVGSWPHQMCFTGVIDDPKRPRLVCENSWGPDRENGGWVSGPRKFQVDGYGEAEIPEGSFCVDAEVAEDRMLSDEDSFAYSQFMDFRPAPVDYSQL